MSTCSFFSCSGERNTCCWISHNNQFCCTRMSLKTHMVEILPLLLWILPTIGTSFSLLPVVCLSSFALVSSSACRKPSAPTFQKGHCSWCTKVPWGCLPLLLRTVSYCIMRLDVEMNSVVGALEKMMEALVLTRAEWWWWNIAIIDAISAMDQLEFQKWAYQNHLHHESASKLFMGRKMNTYKAKTKSTRDEPSMRLGHAWVGKYI